MKLACQSNLKGLHKLYLPLCNGMARGYKFAVSEFGQSAYDVAQLKALNNYKELEMLDLLQELGEHVDPDTYSKVYDKVANPG